MQEAKLVRESQAETVEVVLPNDANPLGNILGGKVMHLIDIAAAIAAHRHSRSYVVTASMDHADFLHPVRIGELIVLKVFGEPGLPHLDEGGGQGVRRKCPDRGAAPHQLRVRYFRGHR